MKKTQLILFAILLALLAVSNTSAAAANKDMIQLQTQVQALQDQMARMQQSFDERMGVMKNLVEQTTDNINRLNQSLDALNKNLQTQSTDQGAKADQVSAQVQSLHDAVDELKARMAKVSKQLDDVQAAQQNLQAQPAAVQPGTVPQAAVQQPQVQAPRSGERGTSVRRPFRPCCPRRLEWRGPRRSEHLRGHTSPASR